ncbi:hypothetical protein [Actinoplanes sichuanensis]|uniref:Uncharacterized protein n=1 Tax=Actinoplanes sichuanensis TaxID=512349 RepID=A0ABW4AWG4_9ACTN|nr:hypothetical protein [Actinoplanes sichuanensis]
MLVEAGQGHVDVEGGETTRIGFDALISVPVVDSPPLCHLVGLCRVR